MAKQKTDNQQELTDLEIKVFNASVKFASKLQTESSNPDSKEYRAEMTKQINGAYIFRVIGNPTKEYSPFGYAGCIVLRNEGEPFVPGEKEMNTDLQYIRFLAENVPELQKNIQMRIDDGN